MNKEQKKEFEQKIILSIEQVLAAHNPKAAGKVTKHIREAGKTVAKKFAKAVKHQDAKSVSAPKKETVNGIKSLPSITVAPKALAAVKKQKKSTNKTSK